MRDYLRADQVAARRYERVKLKLARRYATDHGRYVAEKSAIMSDLLAEANRWTQRAR